jgi:hypothetical protein
MGINGTRGRLLKRQEKTAGHELTAGFYGAFS